ncbi:hypothetical protein BAE44_0019440, partial [Dichanthelium oligosanthes]
LMIFEVEKYGIHTFRAKTSESNMAPLKLFRKLVFKDFFIQCGVYGGMDCDTKSHFCCASCLVFMVISDVARSVVILLLSISDWFSWR